MEFETGTSEIDIQSSTYEIIVIITAAIMRSTIGDVLLSSPPMFRKYLLPPSSQSN